MLPALLLFALTAAAAGAPQPVTVTGVLRPSPPPPPGFYPVFPAQTYSGHEYLSSIKSLGMDSLNYPSISLGGWAKYMDQYEYCRTQFEDKIAAKKTEILQAINGFSNYGTNDYRRDIAQLMVLHKYGLDYGDSQKFAAAYDAVLALTVTQFDVTTVGIALDYFRRQIEPSQSN
nr:CP52k-like protein 14 [Membranobalanus longirostrum]